MSDTPTGPERSHQAPRRTRRRHQRDQRGTLSITTRTCNKLPPVDWLTGEVA